MINKSIGILIFAVIALICYQIFMQVQVSSNTTGYSSLALQATSNWIPLILIAVIVITLLVGLSFKKGR
jgi:hypothetical protein